MTDGSPVVGGMLFLALLALYGLPWMVALVRHHTQAMAIGVLNLLLGWTLLGWVVALVWSCTTAQAMRDATYRGIPAPPLPTQPPQEVSHV